MIKHFPEFSKLSIKHKDEITRFTSYFAPYSDFNFTSLFCWDTDNTTEVSILKGNLIIKMADYISNETLYSIIGNNNIDESLDTLLAITPNLKLVPETVVESIKNHSAYVVSEDRDQFDYVYPLASQADLLGGHYKVKRNKISKFMRTYEGKLSLKKIHFNDPAMKQEIHNIFLQWSDERKRTGEEVRREAETLNKLFDYGKHFVLVGVLVFLDEVCIGFSINEIIHMDYAICHFQKSILTFEHSDVFLTNLVAKELKHFGCKYVNWEQDLGLPGLRELKQSYFQEFFLKKYIVSKS